MNTRENRWKKDQPQEANGGSGRSEQSAVTGISQDVLLLLGLDKRPIARPHAALKSTQWQDRVRAIYTLLEKDEQASIPQILELLDETRERNPKVRLVVVQALETMYQRYRIPPIHFDIALDDSDPTVKACAIQAIMSTGRMFLIERAAQKLQKNWPKESKVQIEALHLFGMVGEQAPLDLIARVFFTSQDSLVREAAVLSIGKLRKERHQENDALEKQLYAALLDQESMVRSAAIWSLGDEKAAAFLLETLESDNESRCEKAIRALAELQNPPDELPDILIKIAQQKRGSQSVRCAAILAPGNLERERLTNQQEKSLSDVLRPLLKARDEDIRDAALLAWDALYPDYIPR